MVDAVVLAGSSNDGPLKDCSSVRYEALIPVGSKSMVEYVVEALLQARGIRRVLVIGPAADLTPLLAGERVSVADSAGGIMENIEVGLKHLSMAMKLSGGNLKLAASKHNGGLGRKKLVHRYVAMVF